MTAKTSTPAERLRKLAETEFRQLRRELAAGRSGKDAGVHRGRKCLQRLRALVRLLAPADVDWARREDAALRRLRRRFGRLRDAAVRLELVQKLGKRPLDDAERARLDRALEQLRDNRAAVWAEHGPQSAFWDAVEKEAARLHERIAKWPFDRLSEKRIDRAMERARLRVRRSLKEALGRIERTHRHDLRRRLRRYAALRRATAHVLRRRDAGSLLLVDLAKELGGEGDLWLAAAALRKCGHASETRKLRQMLEKERRNACKRHDGELAAARRKLLEKPEFTTPAKRRKAAAADSTDGAANAAVDEAAAT